MEHNMILSASGWRKVFAKSGEEKDRTVEIGKVNTALATIAADVFADYVREKTKQQNPVVICGMDTRPTGPAIAAAVIRALLAKNIIVRFCGVTAAPEIMAYARKFDGFIYISASHNPIGHNGIKFGLNDGGVLDADENAKLVKIFTEKCALENAMQNAETLIASGGPHAADFVYKNSAACKKEALAAYRSFLRSVIADSDNASVQDALFNKIAESMKKNPLHIVCDMNGSARAASIDKDFFAECGIDFYSINGAPGEIAHAIIPEGENLKYCAAEVEKLHARLVGKNNSLTEKRWSLLGYMPDCDGDRGNIVYWDEKQEKACVLEAQEVFALSVLSELASSYMVHGAEASFKSAVAVNGATSMRIEEIAEAFGAEVFRAEVGEANVVNRARKAREEGYVVRICGEGSNGGNITYPSCVRDPMATIFAIIKLLKVDGLFKLWCKKSGAAYKDDFTLADILATIPAYTTTGLANKEALLTIHAKDQAALKGKFQTIFEKEWSAKKAELEKKYGITSYELRMTNGTEERCEPANSTDFSQNGAGGLKLLFFDNTKKPCAFMWMRGSKTEPVFRILCDIKGADKTAQEAERELLKWESDMLLRADE